MIDDMTEMICETIILNALTLSVYYQELSHGKANSCRSYIIIAQLKTTICLQYSTAVEMSALFA